MKDAARKVPVSIIVPIKNEASNLFRCLSSVAWADEIFVVDSHSTDESEAIARRFGAQVVQFDFNGVWPKKKNWSLTNLPFSHDWVFILDADEELPADAETEIDGIVSKPFDASCDAIGYWINRRCMFMGKWLKHAYYPNWNLRLFRHETGRYERLVNQATNSGDNEVHEHLIMDGKTANLSAEMLHYAFPTVEIFVEKHNRYSNWEARYSMELDAIKGDGASAQISHSKVRLTRQLKRLVQQLPCRPLIRFLYVYIMQKGFLDGAEGYYFAKLHEYYEFLTVAKIHELKQASRLAKSATLAKQGTAAKPAMAAKPAVAVADCKTFDSAGLVHGHQTVG